MKFMKPLSAAMFAEGLACLVCAIAWGCASGWWAAAMCFCASAVLFLRLRRRMPPVEG